MSDRPETTRLVGGHGNGQSIPTTHPHVRYVCNDCKNHAMYLSQRYVIPKWLPGAWKKEVEFENMTTRTFFVIDVWALPMRHERIRVAFDEVNRWRLEAWRLFHHRHSIAFASYRTARYRYRQAWDRVAALMQPDSEES